jgi:hypothetical protein
MTTRDKGITLPVQATYVNIYGAAVQTTTAANDYTQAAAWYYGPGYISPINSNPVTAVAPTLFTLTGQNANGILLSAQGGGFLFKAGVGAGGYADGNFTFQNTSALGGGWNTAHLILGASTHFWIDAKNRLRMKTSAPVSDTDGKVVGLDRVGSAAFTPGAITTGSIVNTTVTVTGAGLGDFAIGSFNLDLQGIILKVYVSGANTVTVSFQNNTGGTVTLAAGTINVKLIKL